MGKHGYVSCFIIAILALFTSVPGWTAEVRNVTFQQRPGTYLVDIAYDLIGEATETADIEAYYSLNGGADGFPYRIGSATGEFGDNIVPGVGKRIVWDAEQDIPGVVVPDARVRVCIGQYVGLGNIATGVTRSDAAYDDGYYRRGSPRSYTLNGDGTVTDDNTGLMWVQDPDAAGVGAIYTWANAISACESLEYAGYSDWRLPSIEELSTLRDAGRFDPAIDPIFVCRSSNFWSSSVYAINTDRAWYVSFYYGDVDSNGETSYYYVRPVRGGPLEISARFTDHGNGLVTDNNTGLMWVKDPTAAGVGGTYTWTSAITACESLVYAEYSDWRLPNVNELQSLVDYSRYNPAIDPVFVRRSSYFWSSSVYARDTGLAWFVYFGNGLVVWGSGTYRRYVRPVRGGP